MTDLLETVIQVHGGLERWNQLNSASAHLIQGGALWALKGQDGVLADVVVTASLHEEQASHRPFGAADRHSSFTPERVAGARDIVLRETGHFAALERPDDVARILLDEAR